MKTIIKVSVICMSILYCGCKTNSITGRSQLDLVPESELQTMALTEYKDFLSKNPVAPATDQNQEMVRRVGNRIATSITNIIMIMAPAISCRVMHGNLISFQVKK